LTPKNPLRRSIDDAPKDLLSSWEPRNELAGIIFKLAILTVLLSLFYAVFSSAWYWYDKAQLSPEMLSPPVACASSANDELLKGTEFEDHCDYAGFRSFRGDDIVGQFFRAIFAVVFPVFCRGVSAVVLNDICSLLEFHDQANRRENSVRRSFWFVFTYFLMKFADEVYEYWKKGHARQRDHHDDEAP
jgi:hypothetical protein